MSRYGGSTEATRCLFLTLLTLNLSLHPFCDVSATTHTHTHMQSIPCCHVVSLEDVGFLHCPTFSSHVFPLNGSQTFFWSMLSHIIPLKAVRAHIL